MLPSQLLGPTTQTNPLPTLQCLTPSNMATGTGSLGKLTSILLRMTWTWQHIPLIGWILKSQFYEWGSGGQFKHRGLKGGATVKCNILRLIHTPGSGFKSRDLHEYIWHNWEPAEAGSRSWHQDPVRGCHLFFSLFLSFMGEIRKLKPFTKANKTRQSRCGCDRKSTLAGRA